jgi:uncharacterized protein YjbJ (UPF0337 family)
MTSHRFVLAATLLASTLALGACGDTSGGSAQETKGEIKEAAGEIVGDKDLKREGQADQVVGEVKQTADDVKDAVKDAAN